MQDTDRWKLYAMTIDEEHYFLEAHQNRIAFYSGIVTALLAAITAGVLQSSEWYHFAALCVGPILLYAITGNAIEGISRLYLLFLEAITVRAKIEQELGLTNPRSGNADATGSYWHLEPIISSRHIELRKAYQSSDVFIQELSTQGYQGVAIRLFRSFRWLSIPMLIGLLSLMVWKVL